MEFAITVSQTYKLFSFYMSNYRNWCLTWNNYPENWKELFTSTVFGRKKKKLITYWIAGKEVAPETGTPHLQMYIQLRKGQRLTALKKALKNAKVEPPPHLENAKGDLSKNQVYCKKEGSWEEYGVPRETDPKKSSRADVHALRNGIMQGKSDLELTLDDNTVKASAQFQRFAANLRILAREKEAKEREKLRLTDVVLRDWQNQAVLNLDECVLPPVQLTWCPSRTGSHFEEFGLFDTHKYSFK